MRVFKIKARVRRGTFSAFFKKEEEEGGGRLKRKASERNCLRLTKKSRRVGLPYYYCKGYLDFLARDYRARGDASFFCLLARLPFEISSHLE